jgi:hypothetical protein
MIAYITATVWAAFILAAMVGWGTLVVHGLLRLQHRIDWVQTATIGFAFSACLGGIFDLTATASRWLIIGFLAVGSVACVWRFAQRAAFSGRITSRAVVSPQTALVLTAVSFLLILRVAGSIIVLQPPGGMQVGSFNYFDDFQAYFVYPLKILQAGSMGADPFSLRRTPTHSLGGNAFLQTFVLAALPVQSLRILDVGLGTILVAGLLWFYMKRLELTMIFAAAVVFVFLAVPPPLVNVTAVIIPLAFFISLFLILEEHEPDMPRGALAVLIGLHVAAISVLKTILMPAAVAFLAVACAVAVLRSPSRRHVMMDCSLWCAAAFVAILPWLLDSYRWTGTFVPRHLDAYYAHASYVTSVRRFTGSRFLIRHLKELPPVPYLCLTLLAGLLLLVPSRRRVSEAFWGLLGGASIGTVALVLALGGAVNDIYRYMYAFVMSALLVGLTQTIAALAAFHGKSNVRRAAAVVIGVATILLLLSTARQSVKLYWFNVSTLRRVARGEQLIDPRLAAKYRNIQNAVPEKAVLLAHMDYPFLFDFGRNRILLEDHPGLASAAPGQPFFAGPETLANYLVSNGVEYLAYDYSSEASAPEKGYLVALANDDRYPLAQAVVRLTFDFHHNLVELGRTRQRIFDDGTAFVVNLMNRSQ